MKVRLLLPAFLFLLFFHQNAVTQVPTNIGKTACTRCHQMEQRTLAGTSHEKEKSCEGCHGKAEQHLSSGGDAKLIFSYRRAGAEEVRSKCGQCHSNPVMSKHAEGDVACTACHSVHHYVRKKYLLKVEDPETNPA